MVTKKTLSLYGFRSIESYFDYIYESKVNGQNKQVDELIKDLNKEQRHLCFSYFSSDTFEKEHTFYIIHRLIK